MAVQTQPQHKYFKNTDCKLDNFMIATNYVRRNSFSVSWQHPKKATRDSFLDIREEEKHI